MLIVLYQIYHFYPIRIIDLKKNKITINLREIKHSIVLRYSPLEKKQITMIQQSEIREVCECLANI